MTWSEKRLPNKKSSLLLPHNLFCTGSMYLKFTCLKLDFNKYSLYIVSGKSKQNYGFIKFTHICLSLLTFCGFQYICFVFSDIELCNPSSRWKSKNGELLSDAADSDVCDSNQR